MNVDCTFIQIRSFAHKKTKIYNPKLLAFSLETSFIDYVMESFAFHFSLLFRVFLFSPRFFSIRRARAFRSLF